MITVTSPAPEGGVPRVPGSGQGLIGLTERATLTGGRLDRGPPPDGGFRVRGRLPWSGGEGPRGRVRWPDAARRRLG